MRIALGIEYDGAGFNGWQTQPDRRSVQDALESALADCPLGLDWAGLVSVKDSYEWEPASFLEGIEESDIIGIEAPLWTQTILTMKDIEFMTFPRLPGLAEHAWSPKGLPWEEYKQRLAKHGKQLEKLKINFFRSPDIDWK